MLDQREPVGVQSRPVYIGTRGEQDAALFEGLPNGGERVGLLGSRPTWSAASTTPPGNTFMPPAKSIPVWRLIMKTSSCFSPSRNRITVADARAGTGEAPESRYARAPSHQLRGRRQRVVIGVRHNRERKPQHGCETADMSFSADELAYATELVGRWVPPTPQYAWPLLGAEVGADVWVKHEPHPGRRVQDSRRSGLRRPPARPPTRCVWHRVGDPRQSRPESRVRGCANGLAVTIVVPHGNSPDKNASMRALGAEVIEHGHDYQLRASTQ